MRTLAVIPARLAALRLPQKPLRLLGGRPLIVRVWEHVQAIRAIDEVVVATDAPEIMKVVERAGGRAVMTARTHESGTERIAEAIRLPELTSFDTIVNVQGDEPFLPEASLTAAIEIVRQRGFPVGTAAVHAPVEVADTPSVVKVVVGSDGRALYFSRAPIPYLRDAGDAAHRTVLQHLGLYVYTREALEQWVSLPQHPLERIEKLEQLRPLAHGIAIGVAITNDAPEIGIDTEEDLRRANERWDTIHAVGTHAE